MCFWRRDNYSNAKSALSKLFVAYFRCSVTTLSGPLALPNFILAIASFSSSSLNFAYISL